MKQQAAEKGTVLCAMCRMRRKIKGEHGEKRIAYIRRHGYAHRDPVCLACRAAVNAPTFSPLIQEAIRTFVADEMAVTA